MLSEIVLQIPLKMSTSAVNLVWSSLALMMTLQGASKKSCTLDLGRDAYRYLVKVKCLCMKFGANPSAVEVKPSVLTKRGEKMLLSHCFIFGCVEVHFDEGISKWYFAFMTIATYSVDQIVISLSEGLESSVLSKADINKILSVRF